MCKQEFLMQLRKELSGLPKDDIEERLTFYSEMIDDQMEEGLSEAEALAAIGSIDEIVTQAVAETPFAKIAMQRIKPNRRLRVGEIVLLALGSPLWFSLSVAVFAVILSLYVSVWAVVISLWSVFATLSVCAIGAVLSCVIFVAIGSTAKGFLLLAMGIVSAGLSIFAFFGCKAVTKGILLLTKKAAIWLKRSVVKKEES